MKVLSIPHLNQLSDSESGIHSVIRHYFRLAPQYDIDFVTDEDSFELVAIHAGMGRPEQSAPTISHLHGLYWTGDFHMPNWAYRSNEHIVKALRVADQVTVPSQWVAKTLQRDMHSRPHVLPHGVNWQDWQGEVDKGDYVVGYAKNRAGMDVCNPDFLQELCPQFPKTLFYATFAPSGIKNAQVTGLLPHQQMKELVKGSKVFVSTTKETFGIAILEAQAAGVPVLAYRQGGAVDTVSHGITGYLAEPGNVYDLAQGLAYCLNHSDTLGANARELSKRFTWEAAVEQLAGIYRLALQPRPETVAIVIPAYNKDTYLERAVQSALEQTYPVSEIIIVDDGSGDNTMHIGSSLASMHEKVQYIRQDNAGVAHARNRGIEQATAKYICCLDADDWIDPPFVEACLAPLVADKSLGITYTGITWHSEDGRYGNSAWPPVDFNFEMQLRHKNQVPTCCLFRRDLWARLGGFRQRYAPDGAGSEDADLWTRIGAIGYAGKKVTDGGLFHYQLGGQVSSNPNYREVDWLAWHPWARDGQHPFASVAKPLQASHPVRQYDEPAVSVVIPVGPGHGKYLVDALDSLEAQTFRQWEVILVDDSGEGLPESLRQAYPFARIITTEGRKGAGFARNRGAEAAVAPFLLFLDADDWLYPDCITRMLDGWGRNEAAIYSDSVGIATVDDPSLLAHNLQQDMLAYNTKTKEARIRYRAADFDQHKAMLQPENPPYLWCNITTLLPRAWHSEIGGFDESMSSWEDIDYWYRLAWAGKCFCRIPEPLLVYRFYTGTRREIGRQEYANLLEYLKGKRNV